MIQNALEQAKKHFESGDYEQAVSIFLETLQSAEKADLSYERLSCCVGITASYLKLNQNDKALKFHQECELLVEKAQPDEKLLKLLIPIAEHFRIFAQHEKAFDYLLKYSDLEEKLNTEKLLKKIAEVKSGYEMEKRQYESMNIIDQASRLASIGVIIGGITHEINQPLSAINVNSDSVLFWNSKNRGYLPDIIVRAATEISVSAKKIDEIIRRMRHYWTNTEADYLDRINLNSALEEALSLLSSQLLTHSIRMYTDLSDERLTIECNQIFIEQIVINLIVYMLQTSNRQNDTSAVIRISSYKEGKRAQIVIEDNFSEFQERAELSDHVYTSINWGDNFYLGLVIVKQAIDRFKGTIALSPNKPKGATYRISFPLMTEEGR